MKYLMLRRLGGVMLACGSLAVQTHTALAEATYDICVHTQDSHDAGTNESGLFVTLEGVGGFMQGSTRNGLPPNSFLLDNQSTDDFNRNSWYCQKLSDREARFDDIGAIHTMTYTYKKGDRWCFDQAYIQYKVNGQWKFQTDFFDEGCMSGETSDNASTTLVLYARDMPDLNITPPKGIYVRASTGASLVSIGVAKTTVSGIAHSTKVRTEQQRQLSLTVGTEGKFLGGVFGKMNTSLTGSTTQTQSKERVNSFNNELSVQQNCTATIKKKTNDIVWQWRETGTFGTGRYTIQTCDFACSKSAPPNGTTPVSLGEAYQCG